ncbi:unnamed protein product [Choristocarpus tenellus]
MPPKILTAQTEALAMSRVGLVSTFRFAQARDATTVERCWSILESFLLYHLAVGFDHIFLYSDEIEDGDGKDNIYIERTKEGFLPSEVSVRVRNKEQIEMLAKNCKLWDSLGHMFDTEVHARQTLNAEQALSASAERGLDWLLHIDIDELFYTAETSIKPHFSMLDSLGVTHMTYANHEGVPCQVNVTDYFSQVSLFRMNHLMLPISGAIGECMQFWRQRTSHGQYMLAYDNGKSAVRVLPGQVLPESVHRWCGLKHQRSKSNRVDRGNTSAAERAASNSADIESKEMNTGQGRNVAEDEVDNRGKSSSFISRTALVDPRELNLQKVLNCPDPCVLHYVGCGLEWLRDKYHLLGDFPSSWFGGRLTIAPSFHLDARDAVVGQKEHQSEAPTGDVIISRKHCWNNSDMVLRATRDKAAELYRTQVMLCPVRDAKQIQKQLQLGVLREMKGPRQIIEAARAARHMHVIARPLESRKDILSREDTAERVTQSASPNSHSEENDRFAETAPLLTTVEMAIPQGGIPVSGDCEHGWILSCVAREYL